MPGGELLLKMAIGMLLITGMSTHLARDLQLCISKNYVAIIFFALLLSKSPTFI
jgi:hypothetical protein